MQSLFFQIPADQFSCLQQKDLSVCYMSMNKKDPTQLTAFHLSESAALNPLRINQIMKLVTVYIWLWPFFYMSQIDTGLFHHTDQRISLHGAVFIDMILYGICFIQQKRPDIMFQNQVLFFLLHIQFLRCFTQYTFQFFFRKLIFQDVISHTDLNAPFYEIKIPIRRQKKNLH